ncbi:MULTISPECIES: hypothetical protein [unclassified Nodularia (in: cyanobacteria)]|uniref:hypothetical protein n=1 Tax=unclassified Nodularia (in: cyanobacteria) TaxID=2656917 RepID=UPI001881214A|nr:MULTISPECIES: hypothetical protein [unclassified Nodularia (in: cyanobacteria)]MBE9199553.1 hypothetical protein [Nodularia sp. LEGE 06071]MCC2691366.1 hypothetical protein [Nodularia sp. LEGE 04288]
MTTNLPLKFSYLPKSLPLDGAVRIDFVEGVPIFLASSLVQGRIEALLMKQKEFTLTTEEETELDEYEELDDYLSLVNRIIRNTSLTQNPSSL